MFGGCAVEGSAIAGNKPASDATKDQQRNLDFINDSRGWGADWGGRMVDESSRAGFTLSKPRQDLCHGAKACFVRGGPLVQLTGLTKARIHIRTI